MIMKNNILAGELEFIKLKKDNSVLRIDAQKLINVILIVVTFNIMSESS